MIDTGGADQIVMTLHGFSVLGFGFELKPNSDGTYFAGFEYSDNGLRGSATGDGGTDHTSSDVTYYPPYFFGTISDGVGDDDITSLIAYTDIIPNSGLGSTGFYLGDLHFIENVPVPIPSAISLFGLGLLGLAGISMKKK